MSVPCTDISELGFPGFQSKMAELASISAKSQDDTGHLRKPTLGLGPFLPRLSLTKAGDFNFFRKLQFPLYQPSAIAFRVKAKGVESMINAGFPQRLGMF